MKILIVGNGGREYSIGLALKKENNELFFAPGNGATSNLGTNVAYANHEELAKYVKDNEIELTIVGDRKSVV